MKKSLESISKNKAISHLMKKPSFLSDEKDRILTNLLLQNRMESFYELASKTIKNSYEILHLYIYLVSKIDNPEFCNTDITNHICWSLFNMDSNGWLCIKDPSILDYCKKNTTDDILLKEIENTKRIDWFDEYYNLTIIEGRIAYAFDCKYSDSDIEKNVLYYFSRIQKMFKEGKINEKDYSMIIYMVDEETTIKKGRIIVGSLLSRELQELLGFSTIKPKVGLIVAYPKIN
jgi:hypothetical protein